jgi:hypothetical protein
MPSSLSLAAASGAKFYFTGRPCWKGHICPRYARGGCVICVRSAAKEDGRNNRERRARTSKAWAEKNADYIRIKRKEWYKENQAKQSGYLRGWYGKNLELEAGRPRPTLCECCGSPPNGGKKTLNFDHCHETGAFRGWLCMRCNTAIGKLGDNFEGIMRAAVYLKKAERAAMRAMSPSTSTSTVVATTTETTK